MKTPIPVPPDASVAHWLSRLQNWRALPAETECLEFKTAAETFDGDDFGRYVSALANEAALAGQSEAWMVFGVGDRCDAVTGLRPLVGSRYAASPGRLNDVKRRIAEHTSPRVSLTDPVELHPPGCAPGRRVLVWRIPAAPAGMPVAWHGHYYGRDGESLGALALHELETLRARNDVRDWSAVVATDDWSLLDPVALDRARVLYTRRHASHPQALEAFAGWDDREFLHRLHLSEGRGLTRAALLLLGRPYSDACLGGPRPQLSWVLQDEQAQAITHRHFGLPLLTSIDALVACIRILEIALLPPGQLAPLQLPNYDAWVLREALHNAIAHQEYAAGGRVRVTESPTHLMFSNLGRFLPGDVDRVLHGSKPELRYRNPCLAHAMVELDLVETISSGVQKMFRLQQKRFFPLPDFVLADDPPSVSVQVFGQVLDLNYVRALMADPTLTLDDAVQLDRVQKGLTLTAAAAKSLRQRGLIEGRLSRLTISAGVAALTGQEVAYVDHRGLDGEHFRALVLKLLATGPQPRAKIDALLLKKLPGRLNDDTARREYVRNLLKQMTKLGLIHNVGKRTRGALWALTSRRSS